MLQNLPTTERGWLEFLGYPGLAFQDLPAVNISFMEATEKLWKFAILKKEAQQADPNADLTAIEAEEEPFRHKAECYFKLLIYLRKGYRREINKSPEMQKAEYEMCRKDFFHWITYWAWTQDPRLISMGLLATSPFIPFGRQNDMMKCFERWFKGKNSGLIDKSRDEGASVGAIAWCLWHWLYDNGFRASLCSQKEEKVDIGRSTNTLFGKFRFMLYGIPKFFRPPEMAERGNQYDAERKIINPVNNCELIGEIGDNIGRSGRSSVVIIDEWQDIEHPEVVRNSIAATADCKIFIGTMKGMNHFYQMIQSKQVLTFQIRWYEDPRKNPDWKSGKPNMLCDWRRYLESNEDGVTIAQEYDGDPNASVEGSVIDPQWIMSAIDWIDPSSDADRVAGFDVATGRGRNEAIYACRVGPSVLPLYSLPYQTVSECAFGVVERGITDGIMCLNYDQDGIGESLVGMFEMTDRPIPFRIVGLHGNDRASDVVIPEEGRKASEKYVNKRSERWYSLAKRFERTFEHRRGIRTYPLSQLVSIPNDPALISQLSQPRKTMRARMGVESKDSMKSRGIVSPDRADAVVYAFADADDQDRVADRFDYTAASKNCSVFETHPKHGLFSRYASVYQDKDMSIGAVCCMWWPSANGKKPVLQVYAEYFEQNAQADDVARWIKNQTLYAIEPPREVIGNDGMFGDGWAKTPNRVFGAAGLTLKKSYDYDLQGSVMIMNDLFRLGQIHIHRTECRQLIIQQAMWTKEKSGVQPGLGLAMALLQLVARLNRDDLFARDEGEDVGYGFFKVGEDIRRNDVRARRMKSFKEMLGLVKR